MRWIELPGQRALNLDRVDHIKLVPPNPNIKEDKYVLQFVSLGHTSGFEYTQVIGPDAVRLWEFLRKCAIDMLWENI